MASLSLPAQEPSKQQVDQGACGKYNQIISQLPKEESWIQGHQYYKYQGHWYQDYLLEGAIWGQKIFKAKDSGIFVPTYPKCGTTWTKALTSGFINRDYHKIPNPTHPLLQKNPMH